MRAVAIYSIQPARFCFGLGGSAPQGASGGGPPPSTPAQVYAYNGWAANAFPAQLASVLEHLRDGGVAEAERCSAAISAAVADAFAAVVEVQQGNAFTNANKALAHIMAYGRDALEAPAAAPRRQSSSSLDPESGYGVADAPRAPTRTRLPREPLVRIPLGCR